MNHGADYGPRGSLEQLAAHTELAAYIADTASIVAPPASVVADVFDVATIGLRVAQVATEGPNHTRVERALRFAGYMARKRIAAGAHTAATEALASAMLSTSAAAALHGATGVPRPIVEACIRESAGMVVTGAFTTLKGFQVEVSI